MVTRVTHGIKISVQSRYEEAHSRPGQQHYFFSYQIEMENNGEYTVQLLRRHWFIFDSAGMRHEVEGEGVIGQQPVLNPGESYTYDSACNLTSEIGTMHGAYLFRREVDGYLFEVQIPKFELIALHRLN
jgi:ApaG protein